MRHSDTKSFTELETEVKNLNRLNGINQKMVREARQLMRQKTLVKIRGADGSSGKAIALNF